MDTKEEIVMRSVPNADLLNRPELIGLHIQTDFEDTRGRLVSGKLIGVKMMPDGASLGLKIERSMNGAEVLDGARVSIGEFLPGRSFASTVHGPASVLDQ